MEIRGSAERAARGDRLGAGDRARGHARRHGRLVARGDPRRPRRRARARVAQGKRSSSGPQVELAAVGAGAAAVLLRHLVVGARVLGARPSRGPARPSRRAAAPSRPSSAASGTRSRPRRSPRAGATTRARARRPPSPSRARCARTRSRSGRCTRAPCRAVPRRARRARRRTACGSSSRRPACRRRRSARCPRRCPSRSAVRRGPGHDTRTSRPAISDAIAPSRRSLPRRSWRSAIHHASAVVTSAAIVSLTHSGVLGYARVIAVGIGARAPALDSCTPAGVAQLVEHGFVNRGQGFDSPLRLYERRRRVRSPRGPAIRSSSSPRRDLLGPERDRRGAAVRRQVVVIALEPGAAQAEPGRELVQLLERRRPSPCGTRR